MISRRDFIKISGALALTPQLLQAQGSGQSSDLSNIYSAEEVRVWQGPTNKSSSLICALVHKERNFEIQIIDSKNKNIQFEIRKVEFPFADFHVLQINVVGLKLGELYQLSLVDQKKQIEIVRQFKSLDWNNKQVRMAILSCSNHRDADPKTTMFRRLEEAKPDVIFYIGDLVYANSAADTFLNRPAKPEEAFKIYVKTIMEFELYKDMQMIPIFSSWDDHDLAFNNSDSSHPHKQIMKDMFRGFFPCDSRIQGIATGPGVSFSFNAFGLQIVFLDTRYFKSKKNQILLGQEQMDWLKKQFSQNNFPKMIINPQQFIKYHAFTESYQKDAISEFSIFSSLVKSLNSPALFVSGDVHYSQVQKIPDNIFGYPTIELTSSAFFSNSAGQFGKRSIEKGQLHYYGEPNFVMMTNLATTQNKIEAQLCCISEINPQQFKDNIRVDYFGPSYRQSHIEQHL